ncbi:MAG: hypothetical protein F4029_10885 [Gammaproteobacteria bacterium]|nr:hypothetical protein [Gammaproteobacteria bacterium]MYF31070.1 hypothetical protein [Gammaproteobacteria bacterium]MYK46719.1 hypothetical protein [Gammaproteobacteria bacterium]
MRRYRAKTSPSPSAPSRASLAFAAALAAASVVAGEVFELPRSSEEVAVRATVDCVDPGGCTVSQLCLAPSNWIDVHAPDDFDLLEILAGGAAFATPWIRDARLACGLHIAGAARVVGVVEHRVRPEGAAVSRETTTLQNIGMVGVPYDGIATGWGDCRPASEDGACPDREHVAEADCPAGEAPWHAYIAGTTNDWLVDDLYSVGAFEGETRSFRAFAAHFPPGNEWSAYWRVSRGRWHDATSEDQPDSVNSDLVYRVPQVWSDEIERITVTIQSDDGYCATTTIKFRIRDRR